MSQIATPNSPEPQTSDGDAPNPRIGRNRKIARIIAACALLVFFASGGILASRVAQHYRENKPILHYYLPLNAMSLVYHGKPVIITDELDSEGYGKLFVDYAGDQLALDITVPVPVQLPNLSAHRSWMSLMLWREGDPFSSDREQEFRDANGFIDGNLVLVKRNPPPGENPLTRGEVMRSEWTFDFYEFLPEGGFRRSTLRYPESERRYDRRVAEARRAGEDPPPRRADDLKPQTWQHDAAMLTMPTGKAPPAQFNRASLEAGGWAWPLTGTSLVVSMVAAGFGFAPTRAERTPGV